MAIVFEIAMMVAVVWAALQVWTYWQRRNPPAPNVPPREHVRSQLRNMANSSLEQLRGKHGRKRQLLSIAVLMALILFVGLTRSALLLLIVVGVFAIAGMLQPSVVGGEPRPINPPPLPVRPSPVREQPVFYTPEPPKRRRRFFSWWWLPVLTVGLLLYVIPEAREEVRTHVPQLEGLFEFLDGEESVHEEIRQDRGKIVHHEDLHTKIDRMTDRIEKSVDAYVEKVEKSIENAFVSNDVAAPVPVSKPGEKTQDEESKHKGSRVLSAVDATQPSALASLRNKVASRVIEECVQAGHPVEMLNWQPKPEWIQANFTRGVSINQMPSQTPGIDLWQAETELVSIDQKKMDQAFHAFVQDRAAGRSVLLLKGFVGSVLMLGGASVLLRLGTGRQMAPGDVSSKKTWWGRLKRPNR